MPAPVTSDDFLDHLRVSSLIGEPHLDRYLDELRQAPNFPSEPKFLAGRLVNDGLLTSFQAEQLLEGRYKNFIVGNYKLLEPVGSGGMSVIFLCEHRDTGERKAMKVLSRRRGGDPGMLARFLREARIIVSLNHPNIVRAYDIDCNSNKLPYIIMDYVDGVAFDDLVKKRGRLNYAYAAHYIAQAASGLQHLHDAALIHRDIKPGNLVLDRDGIVKLLDLGLARFQQDYERITEKYNGCSILGTADFISPEQTLIGRDLDQRSDIYSLGATFYYLLSGRVPFPVRSAAEKIRSHQLVEPTPLEQLRPEIPAEIRQIVKRMMAKKPGDRFASAKEVAQALAKWFEMDIPPPRASDFGRGGKTSGADDTATPSMKTSGVAAIRPGINIDRAIGPSPARLWLALAAGLAAIGATVAMFMAFHRL